MEFHKFAVVMVDVILAGLAVLVVIVCADLSIRLFDKIGAMDFLMRKRKLKYASERHVGSVYAASKLLEDMKKIAVSYTRNGEEDSAKLITKAINKVELENKALL